jgi:hypothetical protein
MIMGTRNGAAEKSAEIRRYIAEDGGWGGIRTHGALARTAVFKTAALNRSATHP